MQYFDDVFSVEGWKNLPQLPEMEGKTVFITGGCSGLGAFLTAAFTLQGANVGFVTLSEELAEKNCDLIETRTGRRPLGIRADIRDIDVLRAAIDSVRDRFGAISILINNAARDTRHVIESWSVDEWDDSIATNLRAQFFAAQAVAEDMKAAGGGVIINIGSNSYNLGLGGYPTYVTAKGGVVGLTRALARELGWDGIRVNTLVPGWVMTERQKHLWVNDSDLQDCLDQQALKKPLSGWDIAGPALFLASSMSGQVTGQEIVVDGGRAYP
ncbi:MAG: SDR family oxidoreductase [Gammaproteobacteria bacterium]|nr:SDR family oxidoreductase [Gammaproteobacteria bacterium]